MKFSNETIGVLKNFSMINPGLVFKPGSVIRTMNPQKTAHEFDQDLLILFDAYVHGGIDRRTFLDRAAKYAVGGVTAAMRTSAGRRSGSAVQLTPAATTPGSVAAAAAVPPPDVPRARPLKP